ncbi:MAG: hypothetical protein ACM3NT_08110 [Methylocystaceae bacterium]
MAVKAKTSLPGKNSLSETRLGQKFGVRGDELDYTLVPPKKQGEKASEGEYDLMAVLQKIYDLVEAEPGLSSDIKDKFSGLLAKFYHQEEPGFSESEANKLVIRDYHLLRDIPERSASKPNKNRTNKKKRQAAASPVNPERQSQPSPGTAAPKTEPSIADVMAGRPISPMDFRGSAPATRQQRSSATRQTGFNMQPPTAGPRRPGYPPMMGFRAPLGRRPGFGFMGFPMGMSPGRNFMG